MEDSGGATLALGKGMLTKLIELLGEQKDFPVVTVFTQEIASLISGDADARHKMMMNDIDKRLNSPYKPKDAKSPTLSNTLGGVGDGTAWTHGLAKNASYDAVIAQYERTLEKLAAEPFSNALDALTNKLNLENTFRKEHGLAKDAEWRKPIEDLVNAGLVVRYEAVACWCFKEEPSNPPALMSLFKEKTGDYSKSVQGAAHECVRGLVAKVEKMLKLKPGKVSAAKGAPKKKT